MILKILSIVLLTISINNKICVTKAEIRNFVGKLEATPDFIHYSEGFIIAPGYIDISGLKFTVDDNGGDGNRMISEEVERMTQADPAVDIAVFEEPRECTQTSEGCDWTTLGIGAMSEFGDVHWCCWGDALELDICQSRSDSQTPKGHLIMNKTSFVGQSRSVNIPISSNTAASVKFGHMEEGEGGSGKYIIVIANCNPSGRNMTVSGQYVLKSTHGYLPGNLFGAMHFFAIVSIAYLGLLLWYGLSMRCHQDAVIPIQQWILTTISISFLEAFFKAGDYWVWNEDGTRFWFAMYTGVLLGVAKRAIIRCLAITISLGWGVVRDTLPQMPKIITIGIIYALTSAACDICEIILTVVENQTVSVGTLHTEHALFDVITILTFIIAAIDVTFYMWILDALGGTMQYLENLSQHQKLLRYLRLRLVLLLSIVFAITWAVFGIVNTYMEGQILEAEQEWAILQIWHLNYFMVLVSVAILWKPDPNAKEYAFVMQLPAGGEDICNELELVDTNADVLQDDDDDDDNADGNQAADAGNEFDDLHFHDDPDHKDDDLDEEEGEFTTMKLEDKRD